MSTFVVRFLVKVLCVLFWVFLFFGLLYSPYLLEFNKEKNTLNIATWTDMLDEDIIKRFEKETGIAVNISYFDNNDELLVKMRATKGEGYDLIIPSDHTVQLLIQEDLLHILDKSKITIFDRINPRLLNAYFDPDNDYSIPYYWGIYGLGINKDFFVDKTLVPSWDLIFKPLEPFAKVSMLDNPREAILLTALYLFGTIENLTIDQLDSIKKLLIEQKKWIEAYTEFRADYLLLSTTCPVVATTTPLIFRLMNIQKNMDFVVPQEGSFMVTDNWAIPKPSIKTDLVYTFLNFLYQPEIIEYHFDVFTFIPATIDLERLLQPYPSILDAYNNPRHTLIYFKNTLPSHVLNDMWISLKAS